MNWLSNIRPPGLKSLIGKRDAPDNLWIKCPKSGEMIYRPDLEASLWVTPSGAHMRVGPLVRFRSMFDDAKWDAVPLPKVPMDPLKFKDDKKYTDRLKAAKTKIAGINAQAKDTEPMSQDDCMAAAIGRIGGKPAVVLVQDFAFMGGSLGPAAGEAFIAAAELAVARKAALVVCTASGGARMQEGTLSLMQMPRTTLAINDVKEAGLPYIVILCDPTSGGVSASYAMLGDVHIAEPEAMIAFSGPRVIEQTIRQKLPDGFQRSEFLQEKGQVDLVVDRREIAAKLGTILGHLMHDKSDENAGLPPVTAVSPDVIPPEVGA